jgi:hypothetical protein
MVAVVPVFTTACHIEEFTLAALEIPTTKVADIPPIVTAEGLLALGVAIATTTNLPEAAGPILIPVYV